MQSPTDALDQGPAPCLLGSQSARSLNAKVPGAMPGSPTPLHCDRTSLSHVRNTPKYSMSGRQKDSRTMETPGPGAYSTSVLDAAPGKEKHSPRGYGFGTNPRTATAPSPDRPKTAPGPGQYTPSNPRISPAMKQGTFSTSGRKGDKAPPAVNPGPGAYSHSGRIGADGPKFSMPNRLSSQRGLMTPGPGAYQSGADEKDSRRMQSPRHGFGTSSRSVSPPRHTPGPGAYNSDHLMKKGPQYSMRVRRESRGKTDVA